MYKQLRENIEWEGGHKAPRGFKQHIRGQLPSQLGKMVSLLTPFGVMVFVSVSLCFKEEYACLRDI